MTKSYDQIRRECELSLERSHERRWSKERSRRIWFDAIAKLIFILLLIILVIGGLIVFNVIPIDWNKPYA